MRPPTWESFGSRGGAKGGRMGIIRKYGFVSALALAVIYIFAPHSLEDVAKLRWLDDINVVVNKSLTPAKREVGVSSVDPIAAANVDEDLDYRSCPTDEVDRRDGARSWLSIRMAPMCNLRARSSTNWFWPRRLPRRSLPRLRMLGRRIRKLRARTPPWASLPQGPKPPRLAPMKSADATRIVWTGYPTAQKRSRRGHEVPD